MQDIRRGGTRLNKRRLYVFGWGAIVLAYATALVLASGLPQARDLELAGGGANTGWDKVLHIVAFFFMGMLLSKFFGVVRFEPASAKPIVTALAVGSAYAAFHEGLQTWLPGFTFNPVDLLADILGLVLGVGVARLLSRKRQREHASRISRQD